MPASRWRRLLKLKRKKNSFEIIIGFFVTPPLFLVTKVAISFVYCSPKTVKCTQKPKIEKRYTRIDRARERATVCRSPHRIYNSLLRMRAIHELKMARKKALFPAHRVKPEGPWGKLKSGSKFSIVECKSWAL